MDYIDYREKLGLAFNDKEKQQFFITRVFSYLDNSSVEFSHKNEIDFCYAASIKTYAEAQNPNYEIFNMSFNEPVGMKKVAYYLNQRRNDFRDFLATLVMFLNTYTCKKNEKLKIWNDFENMLQDSHIQYELINDTGNIFIFPKGAKELDNALISEPLEWLYAYPNSRKSFVKALKLYSNSSDSNASDVADAFRKSLETFFQEFFNSAKSLEHLKSEYGNFLKSKNVPSEICNNLEKLLSLYTEFMNNYAKHHDKTQKNVLEYIMYQTGNIIRLLITLKHEESNKREIKKRL